MPRVQRLRSSVHDGSATRAAVQRRLAGLEDFDELSDAPQSLGDKMNTRGLARLAFAMRRVATVTVRLLRGCGRRRVEVDEHLAVAHFGLEGLERDEAGRLRRLA